MAIKSPEVMRAWETDVENPATDCDGCGRSLDNDDPIILIALGTVLCLPCVEWALPRLEELEDAS